MWYCVCVVLYITEIHGYSQYTENRGARYGNYYHPPPLPPPYDSFTTRPDSNQNIIPPYSNQGPSYGNQNPSSSNQGPFYGSQNPAYETQNPYYGNQYPSYETKIPSYANQNPPFETQGQFYGNRNPPYSGQNPFYGGQNPAYETQGQFYGNRNSPDSEQGPYYDNENPAYDTQHPLPYTQGSTSHFTLESSRTEYPSYGNHNPPSYGNEDLSNISHNQPESTTEPDDYKFPSPYDNKFLLPWCQDHKPAPFIHFGDGPPTTPKPIASPFKYQNQSECLLDYDDPCNPHFSEKPEFLVPGRRISEAKCMEYIWNIKRMVEIKLKNETCGIETKKNKTGYYNAVPAAVGGRAAFPGEFPHMGAVGWLGFSGEWLFKCGSSLISPNFVLTAAHCSKASSLSTDIADPIPKIVRFSHVNIDLATRYEEALKNDINIKNIIIHPNYNPPKKYFDIALMELERDVGFSQMVQPACLWTSHSISELGAIATLTGWGALKEGSLNFSPILQAAVLDFIGKRQCDSLLYNKRNRNWSGLQAHQICAAKLAGGVDACQGDSGGPLQIKIDLDGLRTTYKMYYVVGVTAFGFGCARRNLPGVYTRVSSFTDWIEPIVWK